jgi:hypothetical protein
MPFLLDSPKKQEPTLFEINIFCENVKYNYSIILDSDQVYSEHLSFYPKKYKKNIFTRDLTEAGDYIYNFGEDLKPKRI